MPRRNGLEPGFRQHWNLHKTGKGRSEWSLIFFLGPPKGSHAGVQEGGWLPKAWGISTEKGGQRQAGWMPGVPLGRTLSKAEGGHPSCL